MLAPLAHRVHEVKRGIEAIWAPQDPWARRAIPAHRAHAAKRETGEIPVPKDLLAILDPVG
jgi:hypothetical protein